MVGCRDYRFDTVSSMDAILSLAIPATFWAKVASFDESYDLTIQEALRTESDMLAACWTQSLSIKVANTGYGSA
jgi:hypothetical protein